MAMPSHLLEPIPLAAGRIPEGWREVPIASQQDDDDLVPIGPFSAHAPDIFTTSVYAGEHSCSPYTGQPLDGATITTFLRRHVAIRLQLMQAQLPGNHYLVVFDGFRNGETQTALYNRYFTALQQQKPTLSIQELHDATQRYVSLPSANPPSPHRTGGAVDVVIVTMPPMLQSAGEALRQTTRELAQASLPTGVSEPRRELEVLRHALMTCTRMLNFGTPFDHGSEKSNLTYFETRLAQGHTLTADEQEALLNRRLLYNIAINHDMVPYAEEWWHLDAIETQRGAASQGISKAALAAAELRVAHHEFEAKRRKLLPESGQLRKAGEWPMEIIAPQP